MTFRQLELFLLVVRLGTISAAATKVGISQSGASHMIAELEKRLGFELFFRSGRGIELTEQGAAYYTQVERHFLGMDSLNEAARQIRAGILSRLRIACLPTMSTSILPGIVSRLQKARPEIGIELEAVNLNQAIRLLKSKRADVAITFLGQDIDGISFEKLAEAPYVFAAHESHELAKKDEVHPEDLIGHEIIGFIPNSNTDSILNQYVQLQSKLDATGRTRTWCQTSATRYALIAAGKHVSVAEPFSAPLFRSMGVVTRKFTPQINLQYGLAAETKRLASPEIKDLKKAIIEELKLFAKREKTEIETA